MPHSFFRLDYASPSSLDTLMREGQLPEKPVDLPMKVRGGDFVLAAKWNDPEQLGEVRAIGRVVHADGCVQVEWRSANFDLRPNPQAQQFWRKDHFRFADSVVDRYMLKAVCAEHFPEATASANGMGVFVPGVATPPSGTAHEKSNAGHVYVIRSPYGYKIGKTRTLRDRTRLFAVKLPFPIDVVMTGWFADYSAAERQLHRQFADKRLEGEWFDLSPADLRLLRAMLSGDEAK